jgi:hypothetical protein
MPGRRLNIKSSLPSSLLYETFCLIEDFAQFLSSALKKTFLGTDWRHKASFKTELMWISIKRHDFTQEGVMEFPAFITPPPPYGPLPPPHLMMEHIPNYAPIDEEEVEPADLSCDFMAWETLQGEDHGQADQVIK